MATFNERTARWLIVVAVVSIALATAGSIETLHRSSDQHRQAEVLIVQIEGFAHRLNNLEWKIESGREAAAQVAQEFDNVRAEYDLAMGQLRTLAPDQSTQSIETAFSQYEAEVRTQDASADAGHGALDAPEADRSYTRLLGATSGASHQHRNQVQDSMTLASTGSAGLLFVGLLLTAGVLMKYDQIRRSEQKRQQEALRQSEEHFRSMVRHASDVIHILDQDGTIQYESPATQRVWGYPAEGLHGRNLLDFVHSEDIDHVSGALLRALSQPDGTAVVEVRVGHAEGAWRCCELILQNALDDPGLQGILATFHDVTDRKNFEQELARLAFQDPLTQLPNRARFMQQLEAVLSAAEPEQTSAVLFLDLDDFQVINDSLGHPCGDELLVTVADRLRSCLQADNLAARLGGDEFAILLVAVEDARSATQTAQTIIETLKAPFNLSGREVYVSGSIGVALSSRDIHDPQVLLRHADLAMYRAKSKGKARCEVYDRSMNAHIVQRLELETDLRRAIEHQELAVYYQPLVDTFTGRTAGLEALVRWNHPRRGLVSPAEFIPLAEETGLILPIGEWVLREACRHTKEWQETHPADPPLTVSVNLSGRQFQHPRLVEQIAAILEQTALRAASLTLEITESVMMQDVAQTAAVLQQLKALGITLAVDDFGTGYSSLSYLKRFPIDMLKIDRSFIEGLGTDPEDTAIVEAVITLAKALHVQVTGEGTETANQVRQLQALGCNRCQGYYFSRPLPRDAVSLWLSAAADRLTDSPTYTSA
ncbi:MAG TPA: EAL domain-containing protein [Symbiobacteriaceae bacterium]